MRQVISLVTLGVADLAAARAFYARLGWREAAGGNDQVAFFACGRTVLSLYGRADLEADMGLPVGAPPPRPGGMSLAVNVDSRADVDATLAEAVAAGGTLLRPAFEAPWGGVVGYFADPDGHPWEVTWAPMFELREDGTIILGAGPGTEAR